MVKLVKRWYQTRLSPEAAERKLLALLTHHDYIQKNQLQANGIQPIAHLPGKVSLLGELRPKSFDLRLKRKAILYNEHLVGKLNGRWHERGDGWVLELDSPMPKARFWREFWIQVALMLGISYLYLWVEFNRNADALPTSSWVLGMVVPILFSYQLYRQVKDYRLQQHLHTQLIQALELSEAEPADFLLEKG
jgi:hypothetical protein